MIIPHRHRLAVAAAILAPWITACGVAARPELQPRRTDAVVRVQDRWLQLRLSQPALPARPEPLVLYITGDGGWRGKDLDAFQHLAAWGYPVVGFSAPAYLDHLAGNAEHLPPQALARDLAEVIAAARARLGIAAATPVILVGVSRGADLAVVGAAQRTLRAAIGGVVAIGLTAEEEYVRRPVRRRRRADRAASSGGGPAVRRPDAAAPAAPDEPEMVKPYEALRRVDTAVSVIQSTNDEYVRAADARVLFGPDSPLRQFHAIESRNHSFSDTRDELYAAMRASLDWVATKAMTQ